MHRKRIAAALSLLALGASRCNTPPIACGSSQTVYCSERADQCYCTSAGNLNAHRFDTVSGATRRDLRVSSATSTVQYTPGVTASTTASVSEVSALLAPDSGALLGLRLTLTAGSNAVVTLARMPSPHTPTLEFVPLQTGVPLLADPHDFGFASGVLSGASYTINTLTNFTGALSLEALRFDPVSGALSFTLSLSADGVDALGLHVNLAGSLVVAGVLRSS